METTKEMPLVAAVIERERKRRVNVNNYGSLICFRTYSFVIFSVLEGSSSVNCVSELFLLSYKMCGRTLLQSTLFQNLFICRISCAVGLFSRHFVSKPFLLLSSVCCRTLLETLCFRAFSLVVFSMLYDSSSVDFVL